MTTSNRTNTQTAELRALSAGTGSQSLGDLLLEITTDGVLDWDLARSAARYSARWKLMLGYEEHELTDTPELVFLLTHPDDLAALQQHLRDHLEQFWPFAHTWRMRHRTGEWRWIYCHAVTSFSDQGVPQRFVGVFSDFSDRIKAETRNRALVTAIPDAMLRVRRDGSILDSKPPDGRGAELMQPPSVGESLFAWPPAAEWIHEVQQALESAIDRGETGTLEASAPVPERERRQLEIRVVRSGDDEAVLIIRDVTQKRKLEAQLNQAHKLEAMGQLAAGVAHEINTPMQYIGDNVVFLQEACTALLELQQRYVAALQAAAARPLSVAELDVIAEQESQSDLPFVRDNVPRSLEAALEGVRRVSKIVQAMKEFSHPRSSEKTLCDLNHEIETTLTISENSWKYVADLETRFDPALPRVRCLPGEINQVILNLVINAAHAITDVVGDGSRGKGKITIETRQRDALVEIRISDTGAGIPEAIRGRIFDPFFTTKEVGKGTGQGLPLSRSIVVDKHGGELDFVTEVGHGTTFIVRIPQ